MSSVGARYDERYFDRWYRDAKRRVFTPAERARRVAVAVSAAEYVLGRRLENVLDIGAGEGHWRAPLLAVRPRVRYVGYDPSEYAVNRFGTARNIRLGDVDTLANEKFPAPFDLVLAVGFLNLLAPRALGRAVRTIRTLVRGVALLELFTSADPLTGDIGRYHLARPQNYRRLLARTGFESLGLHLYATSDSADPLALLERAR
jgi:SAM-dependent methyltransferase